MPTIAKTASPAAVAVLRQATALWPKRKKASDGLLPSKAHIKQNPNSDHNTGLAVDLTHDPKRGVDCADLFERLKADNRVSYLIFNRRIWVDKQGEKKYSGSNPHEKHLHISIKKEYAKDDSPWFAWASKPKKTPVTVTKTAIAKVQKPKKKLPKTKNDKLRNKSLLASLFKRGKK
ncbi:MAG: hypothetical protein ACO3E4_06860 [Candidatus Nanopelagicaceae bacterium]